MFPARKSTFYLRCASQVFLRNQAQLKPDSILTKPNERTRRVDCQIGRLNSSLRSPVGPDNCLGKHNRQTERGTRRTLCHILCRRATPRFTRSEGSTDSYLSSPPRRAEMMTDFMRGGDCVSCQDYKERKLRWARMKREGALQLGISHIQPNLTPGYDCVFQTGRG